MTKQTVKQAKAARCESYAFKALSVAGFVLDEMERSERFGEDNDHMTCYHRLIQTYNKVVDTLNNGQRVDCYFASDDFVLDIRRLPYKGARFCNEMRQLEAINDKWLYLLDDD